MLENRLTTAAVAFAAALAYSTPSTAQQFTPTGREMYVSCFLLTQNMPLAGSTVQPYSPDQCAGIVLNAIATREGPEADTPYKFCLPDDAGTRMDPANRMAMAYIDWFERQNGSEMGNEEGRAAFVIAMMRQFPCVTE